MNTGSGSERERVEQMKSDNLRRLLEQEGQSEDFFEKAEIASDLFKKKRYEPCNGMLLCLEMPEDVAQKKLGLHLPQTTHNKPVRKYLVLKASSPLDERYLFEGWVIWSNGGYPVDIEGTEYHIVSKSSIMLKRR